MRPATGVIDQNHGGDGDAPEKIQAQQTIFV